jgi:Putative zinc-finger
MRCKAYQKWIREAALGVLTAVRRTQLDAHLATCANCALFFEAEQALLAAIDHGLRCDQDAQPSPDLAARVRLRMAAERERSSSPGVSGRRFWGPISALAAVATLLLAIWFARRPPRPFPQQAKAAAPPTAVHSPSRPGTAEPRSARNVSGPLTASVQTSRHKFHGAGSRHATREDRAAQLQVLVQPGQWAGIMALYRAAQAGRVDAGSLAATSAHKEGPLKMEPLEISPLTIATLQPPKPIEPVEPDVSIPRRRQK